MGYIVNWLLYIMTEDQNISETPRKVYYCSKCGTPFHFKMRRNWFIKRVLFFLPIKKYFCARCKKSSYIFARQDEA